MRATQAKRYASEVKKKNKRLDQNTLKLITGTADETNRKILRRAKPDLKFPVRSLANVSYSKKSGYLEIGKQKKVRTLTVSTVKTFAQALRMMSLSKELIETNDFATKRDAYYQSKNWGDAGFQEQTESDTVMDDIEAMFSMYKVSRERLRFIPDEHGGAVAGQLIVYDPDIETGAVERIDCARFGSGAYSIPSSVEHLSFETKAKFVLAIETGGMFQRLQSHKFWQKAKCILVSMGGVPTRATRRFIRKLSEEAKIPVYAFVDCDPYGISNIYRTLKVGSGNAAPLPGSDSSGHPGLQAAHPSPQGGRHQARQGRAQERSFFQESAGLDASHHTALEDGGARRATGSCEVGAELCARRVPAAETEEGESIPSLKENRAFASAVICSKSRRYHSALTRHRAFTIVREAS
jgi:DNA topoisomerase-6 subunit A